MVVTDMDRPRRRLSDLSSTELSQRASEYRRMALTARDEATIKSLNVLAARYAMLAAKSEVKASANPSSDPGQSEVRKLVGSAEQAAANVTDPVKGLAGTIKMITASDADPYLTMGMLVEGAVYILRTSLPSARQEETGVALQKLLYDRLQATGTGA